MDININSLPTWVVGMVMLYTAYIWLISIKHSVRMDSRAIAYTLAMWGVVYALAGLSNNAEAHLIERIFMSRVIIMLICLSQSVPLTVSLIRGRFRGE